MASMDECLRTVAEQGDVLFETYVKNLESKRGEVEKIKAYQIDGDRRIRQIQTGAVCKRYDS